MTASAAERLLPAGWEQWEASRKQQLLTALQANLVKRRAAGWTPYPWQVPPVAQLQAQEMWLQLGGRGTGKTDGASHYVLDHVAGPACSTRVKGGHRLAIVAPTLGDAVESCVRGPSGLASYDPRVTVTGGTGGTYVRFPGGAEAKLFGASSPSDVERLRAGGNRCLVWLEEAAAMRYLAGVLEHTRLGLRVGPRPHYVASTTPKPRPELRKLLTDKRVHVTRGRTDQAHHLDQAVRDVLQELYAGTRLGRQELDGEVLLDVEGALWTQALIDVHRVPVAPDCDKVVVAIDPNAGGPDEAGVVVIGRGADQLPDTTGRMSRHAYVLADRSKPVSSSAGWARIAVEAYREFEADAIVAEVNNGGDMVGLTVRQIDPTVRYRAVRATRGKAVRAEPVVQLYEQGRMHHVGTRPALTADTNAPLARLEDQMTTWTDEADWSPDRMDALVWGATDVLLTRRGGAASAA